MSEASHPRPNQRWAHFLVLSEIARGNMGVVYRARDARNGRDVALKVLLGQRTDPESVERFQRESKSLARLGHRAIVKVEAWGVHEGLPYLAMEFVPGTNLQELLDAGPLPLPRAVDLLARVARAIDHAHSRGVVHRDLKPANVLVGPDGAPRITDFGLARLSDASTSLTQEGDLVGTPVFMSPEQIKGEIRALGPSTDVWALGVILYLLLTGELPFRGTNVEEVGRRVVQDDPTPPRARNPEVTEDLERICLTALRKDPRSRYQSAGELARDLDAFLRGRPVLAGRVTLAVRARRAARAARLHAGPLAIAGAGLLLVAGLGLAMHLRSRSALDSAVAELRQAAEREADAAGHELTSAREALALRHPGAAATGARSAGTGLRRAAALFDRAARLAGGQVEGLAPGAHTDPPRDEEVTRGLERQPALGARLLAARALETRAGILLPEPPREDAEEVLTIAFLDGGELAAVDALADLAERRASLEVARRARRLLDASRAAAPDRPEAILVRARLARQGALSACEVCAVGEPPRAPWRCAYCGHSCREAQAPCVRCGLRGELRGRMDDVGAAAREAEARLLLLQGRPQAARLALGEVAAPDEPPSLRLLRAELLCRTGDAEEGLGLLRPLLALDPPHPEALLEAARARVCLGLPGSALALLEQLARTDAPRALQAEGAACATLAAHLQGRGSLDSLADLADDGRAPLAARLEAARTLFLLDPGLGKLPALPAAAPLTLVQARARAVAARAAGRAEEALGLLARARVLGESEPPEPGRLEELLDAARGAPDPWILAVAGLLLARQGAERADELARVCEALPALSRLLGRPSAPRPALEPWLAEPPGLATGVAALGGLAAAPRGADEHQRQLAALRGLTLAVRRAPLDPWPRVQRARLQLRRAATLSSAPESAREAALTDAAVAAFLAPDEPVAASLLDQVRWVVGRRTALGSVPGPWELLLAPSRTLAETRGEPGEALALAHLPARPAGPWELEWLDAQNPDDLAAWRLQRELALAAGGTPPNHPDPQRLATLLEERLRAASGAEAQALLEAQRLLEAPAAIDEALLAGGPRVDPREQAALLARLRERGPGNAASAVARALALLRQLQAIPPPPGGEALRREALHELRVAARRRPSPGLSAVEAALRLAAPEPPGREELLDLLEPGWSGSLAGLLRSLAQGLPAPGDETTTALRRLPSLSRLEGATSSAPPRSQ